MGSSEITKRALDKKLNRNTGPGPTRDSFPRDRSAESPGPENRDGEAADAQRSASAEEQGLPSPSCINESDTATRWSVLALIDEYASDGPPAVLAVSERVEVAPHVRNRWTVAWTPLIEVGLRSYIGVGVDRARELVSLWRPRLVILDGIEPGPGLRGSQRTVTIAGQGKRTKPRPRRRKPIEPVRNLTAPKGWRPRWTY